MTEDHPQKVDFDFFPNYTTRAFRPYAIAIGEVALLGRLFWTVSGPTRYIALAVWYSIKVDRAQRDMLRAAAQAAYANSSTAKALEDIEWILSEANKIEDLRNDALHSPVILFGNKTKQDPVPADHFGHIRAKKLSEKDFLKEFRRFRDTATTLRDFAAKIDMAIAAPHRGWPKTPRLPIRGETRRHSKLRLQV